MIPGATRCRRPGRRRASAPGWCAGCRTACPGCTSSRRSSAGERRFVYWRDSAAARILFDLPDGPVLIEALAGYDLLYFSGITLSIYGETGRDRLFAAIDAVRRRGGRVAFDTNFRPRGWPAPETARTLYRQAFAHADFVVASTEDLDLLFGAGGEAELRAHAAAAEVTLKLAWPAVRVTLGGVEQVVEAPPVARLVDTTAAGDSFAAAYLAARLRGASTVAAAQAGHRLAGIVVQYPGAIIPPRRHAAREPHRRPPHEPCPRQARCRARAVADHPRADDRAGGGCRAARAGAGRGWGAGAGGDVAHGRRAGCGGGHHGGGAGGDRRHRDGADACRIWPGRRRSGRNSRSARGRRRRCWVRPRGRPCRSCRAWRRRPS